MKPAAFRFGPTTVFHAAGLVALAIVGFLLLAGLASAMIDLPVLLNRFAQVRAHVLGGLAAMIGLHVGLRFLRWPVMSRALALHVPLHRMAMYYLAGTALVPTPGKIGTALRLWLLKRHHHVDYTISTPMLVVENLTDFLALTLLAALAFVPVAHAIAGTSGLGLGLLVMSGLLALVLSLLLKPALLVYALSETQHFFASSPRIVNLLEYVKTTLMDLRRLATLPVMLTTLTLAIAGWVAAAVGLVWIVQALDYDLTLMQALFVLCAGTLMGAITLLPGGVGGTEATMAGLLLAFGLPMPDVVVAVAMIRLALLWVPVLVGFGVLPFTLPRRHR